MYKRVNRYNYLEHHGILGMKWGIRRYQNEDGTLTDAGKRRYNIETWKKEAKDYEKRAEALDRENRYDISTRKNNKKEQMKNYNEVHRLYAEAAGKRGDIIREQKGEKAEEKHYIKETASRIRVSNAIDADFGLSQLKNTLAEKKGKKYAEDIFKKSVDEIEKQDSKARKRATALYLTYGLGLAVGIAGYTFGHSY